MYEYQYSAADAAGIGTMMLVVWGISLLIMVVLGFVVMNIMAKKGYSKGLGFVLGFFGGIVGLIIALVLNPKVTPVPLASGYGPRGQVAATEYPAPFQPQDYYGQ